jgi:hypothetical protein
VWTLRNRAVDGPLAGSRRRDRVAAVHRGRKPGARDNETAHDRALGLKTTTSAQFFPI